MPITDKYLQMILPRLAINDQQKVETKTVKGSYGYAFACPFCQFMCDTETSRDRRVAHLYLMSQKESFVWTFFCNRKRSDECRKSMSFPNFLAMFDSDLFNQFQAERFHGRTTDIGHVIKNPKFK